MCACSGVAGSLRRFPYSSLHRLVYVVGDNILQTTGASIWTSFRKGTAQIGQTHCEKKHAPRAESSLRARPEQTSLVALHDSQDECAPAATSLIHSVCSTISSRLHDLTCLQPFSGTTAHRNQLAGAFLNLNPAVDWPTSQMLPH